MSSPDEIYNHYINAKQISTNKQPRRTKLTVKQETILNDITDYFNTKWQNINPHEYFLIGFNLFKTFNFDKFFHDDIIKNYIQLQKEHNRKSFNKEQFDNSIKYVYTINKSLEEYTLQKNNYTYNFITDYLQNKIDKYTITYLFTLLSSNEVEQIKNETYHLLSHVFNNYDNYLKEIINVTSRNNQ